MSETDTSHTYSDLHHCDTNYATKFYPWEKGVDEYWNGDETWMNPDAFRFSNKKAQLTYLEQLHRGIRNGKRTNKPYFTRADNVDLIGNVAFQIGLTSAQASRAKSAYFYVHPDRIKGERKDVTAVAVCLYVAVKAGRPFHPQKHDENGVPLADRYGWMFVCDPSDIVSRYGKVQHHLRNGIPNFAEEAEREPKSILSIGEDPFHDEVGIGEGGIYGLDHSSW